MPLPEQRVLSIPGVSQLTFKDEPLFRIALPTHTPKHFQNWLYVLRASHVQGGKPGYKFISSELVAVIGHRNGFVYVTPLIDTTGGVRLRELCEAISGITTTPIILKKLSTDVFRAEIPPTTVHDSLPLEDDSYPETIIRLDKLFVGRLGQLNPTAKRVGRKLRAFDERGQHLRIVHDMREVPFQAVQQFLRQWPAKHDSYIAMLRYLRTQPTSPRYRCAVFMDGTQIKGIYVAEKRSLTEAGLYCAVTTRDEPGITEWMDMYFFKRLFRENIQTVYLGGSERAGIAHFVEKLLPYKPPYVVYAVPYPGSPARNEALTIRLAGEHDIRGLADMYREAYNAMDELGERWTKESARKFVSHFYRRQPDLFFVAELNGQLVGATVAAIQPWWDGNHLVEGEAFVHPRCSAAGVEKKLLKKLLLTARDTYHVVAWDTILPTVSEHPLAAYEQVGFYEVPHWRAVSGDMTTLLARLGI